MTRPLTRMLAGALVLAAPLTPALAQDEIEVYFLGTGQKLQTPEHHLDFLVALDADYGEAEMEWAKIDTKGLRHTGGDTRDSFAQGVIATNRYEQERAYVIAGVEVIAYRETSSNALPAIGIVGEDDGWLFEMAETAAQADSVLGGYDADPYDSDAADLALAFMTRIHHAGDGLLNIEYNVLEEWHARNAFLELLRERGDHLGPESDTFDRITPEVVASFQEAVAEMSTRTLTTFDDEETGKELAARAMALLDGILGRQPLAAATTGGDAVQVASNGSEGAEGAGGTLGLDG